MPTGKSNRWRRLWIESRRHWKTALGLLIFGCLWAAMVLWLYLSSTAAKDWQTWIELFNGATWSGDWESKQGINRLGFAMTVATRTVVNIAGPVGAIAAAVWFLFGGLERYMYMSHIELLRLLNAELVPSLVAVLKGRGYDLKPDDRDEMLKCADEVVESFVTDVERHSKKED